MRAEHDAVDLDTEVQFQVTLDREFDGLRERSEHAQARFEQEIQDNVVHLLNDRVRHHQVEIMDIHASARRPGAAGQEPVGTVIKIGVRDLAHEDVSEIRKQIGGGDALRVCRERDAFRPYRVLALQSGRIRTVGTREVKTNDPISPTVGLDPSDFGKTRGLQAAVQTARGDQPGVGESRKTQDHVYEHDSPRAHHAPPVLNCSRLSQDLRDHDIHRQEVRDGRAAAVVQGAA